MEDQTWEEDRTNPFSDTSNKASSSVLEGLEKVADYCDKLDIALVKINDLELVISIISLSTSSLSVQVTEYNLGELPALVYYRHTIPILYEGPLEAEDDLLEWLIQNRNSGDEEDVIEDVQFKSLEAMVAAVENIAVLFCEYSLLLIVYKRSDSPRFFLQTTQSQQRRTRFWKAWRRLTTIATAKAFTLSRLPILRPRITMASPPSPHLSTSRTASQTFLTVSHHLL